MAYPIFVRRETAAGPIVCVNFSAIIMSPALRARSFLLSCLPTACAVGYRYDRQLRWLGFSLGVSRMHITSVKPALARSSTKNEALRTSWNFGLAVGTLGLLISDYQA